MEKKEERWWEKLSKFELEIVLDVCEDINHVLDSMNGELVESFIADYNTVPHYSSLLPQPVEGVKIVKYMIYRWWGLNQLAEGNAGINFLALSQCFLSKMGKLDKHEEAFSTCISKTDTSKKDKDDFTVKYFTIKLERSKFLPVFQNIKNRYFAIQDSHTEKSDVMIQYSKKKRRFEILDVNRSVIKSFNITKGYKEEILKALVEAKKALTKEEIIQRCMKKKDEENISSFATYKRRLNSDLKQYGIEIVCNNRKYTIAYL